jgi:hypothetical protein
VFNVFKVFGVVFKNNWILQAIVYRFFLIVIRNIKLKTIKMPFVTFHLLVVKPYFLNVAWLITKSIIRLFKFFFHVVFQVPLFPLWFPPPQPRLRF